MVNSIRIIFLIWNLIVFCHYGLDKKYAIHHKRRVPERTLLLESLFLGAFGAVLAAYFFHHKTRKMQFVITWVLGIIISILFLAMLMEL